MGSEMCIRDRYKSDSSTDLDKDPLPDDGGDDNQGGSGSGEAPDPAA